MRGLRAVVQRVIAVCLMLGLIGGGLFTGATGSAQATSSAADVNNIYYLSNNDLYRAGTDGTVPVKLQENFTHGWVTQAGDYLFYRAEEENFTPLMRISSVVPDSEPMKFSNNKSILWYQVDGNQMYYMEQSGKIFKTSIAATDPKQAVLVTSMADSNFPFFKVINGMIYFNSRKDGVNVWVASKQIGGKGSVQWIAKGALKDDKFIHTYQNNIYMMVNTNPHEFDLSTDCMVLYIIPIKGGKAKAVNAKKPLGLNSVDTGAWVQDSFIFNKNIGYNEQTGYDYKNTKSYLLRKDGSTVLLSKTGIKQAVSFTNNRIAYLDADNMAKIITLSGSKVTGTKSLPTGVITRIDNFTNSNNTLTTVMLSEKGTFILNTDLSLTKLPVEIQWNYYYYSYSNPKNLGIYYLITEGDEGLYYLGQDADHLLKITEDDITEILAIGSF